MLKYNLLKKLKKYHFEFRHVTLLLLILIIFQLILSLYQKSSLHDFLKETQHWYQQDSAERLANLTATSLELLVENTKQINNLNYYEEKKIVQSFNIIFSQQLLQQNVKNIFLIIPRGGKFLVIDNGTKFYRFLTNESLNTSNDPKNLEAVNLYLKEYNAIREKEQIYSKLSGKQTFHIFVPFVPNGEFIGVLYMKVRPDFSFITEEIISSYDEASLIYSSLILLGLITVYFISSYTLKERNRAQSELFEEKSKNIKEQIEYNKESLFTKRIYHTHHKAEKIMGFIKEDLHHLNPQNTEEVKARVSKYANFISRVIYDMKWYDPPINTVRNSAFRTNLNEVIRFIVDYIFLRITSKSEMYDIHLNLDENLPIVFINEYVIWEIIEPLIQNSIDHSPGEKIDIIISTKFDPEKNISKVIISDNGKGLDESLLEIDQRGIKKIFLENVSISDNAGENRGYGAYISFEIAKRCGWKLDAYNNNDKGCRFEIIIPN